MKVSVNKEKLMEIVTERAILNCSCENCTLSMKECKTKIIDGVNGECLCDEKNEIIDELDVKDLPDHLTDKHLLSLDERAILRNLLPRYKYIARDSDCRLYLYEGLPTKGKTAWDSSLDGVFWCTKVFDHLFQCVKWTDQKPWLISDLLEAKKPTVDWSKVPVDTKVLVWGKYDETWLKRYFAKYENDKVYCFNDGGTSFSKSPDSDNKVKYWEYAKLYEEGEE